MEVIVGARDVKFVAENDEMSIENLCLGLKPFVKEIRECILSRKIKYQMLQVSDEQYLFLFVTELGNMIIFYLESSEHLCFISEKSALEMLQKINLRYVEGVVFIKRPSREALGKVTQVSWRELHRYNTLGLGLFPGQQITKSHILKGHRIFEQEYAKKNGFEPKTLEDLSSAVLSVNVEMDYNEKSFASVPYFLLRHEGDVIFSVYEDFVESQRVCILL